MRVYEEAIPKGNVPEGFLERDTGKRDIALLHPAMGKAAKSIQRKYDVYFCRMCPVGAAYIVPREQWPDFQERMMDSIERFLRGR